MGAASCRSLVPRSALWELESLVAGSSWGRRAACGRTAQQWKVGQGNPHCTARDAAAVAAAAVGDAAVVAADGDYNSVGNAGVRHVR